MSVIKYFSDELKNPKTNYFIFDTKGGGEHGDIDFVKYEWSPSRYNLVKESDLFIYRRPGGYSETKEFYFFGVCKIGKIKKFYDNANKVERYSASFSKYYPFRNMLLQNDLINFKWKFKQRGQNWEHFFNQYGMNKITRDDFIGLIQLSEEDAETIDIDIDSEIEAIQSIQQQDYSAEDSKSERVVRSKQKPFSDKVKLIYRYSCCVCSIRTKEFLVGSHIIPWSKRKDIRLDPSNGLCLCAFHDKAFDTGYMTIDKDFRVKLSKEISKDLELSRNLKAYENRKIFLPSINRPKIEYLEYHWTNIFKN